MCIATADASELSLYGSVDEAAVAALENIQEQPRADRREYIGLIYEDPDSGEYTYTQPGTTGRGGNAKGSFKVPKGSARGIYHNHPPIKNDRTREYFSEDDMNTSEKTGLPSYIDHGDGISVWNPEKPGDVTMRGGRRAGIGTPVDVQINSAQRARLSSIFNEEK